MLFLLDKDTPTSAMDRVVVVDFKTSKPVVKANSANDEDPVPLYIRLNKIKPFVINDRSIVFELQSPEEAGFLEQFEQHARELLMGHTVQNRLVDERSSFLSCVRYNKLSVYATREQTEDLSILTKIDALYLSHAQFYSTTDMQMGLTFQLTHLETSA